MNITPEELHHLGTTIADLVDAKVAAHVADLKHMVAQAVDAGHASITRADQLETKSWRAHDLHERRIQRLEKAVGLPPFEDDFPLRSAGE